MMVNCRSLLYIILLLTQVTSVYAIDAEIVGDVKFASDYRHRGISQTAQTPQVSGNLTLVSDWGLYAGIWGSNTYAPHDANLIEDGVFESLEMNAYAGFQYTLMEDLTVNLGYTHYLFFPTELGSDISYLEVYGNLSYSDFSIGFNVSPAYYNDSGLVTYVYADYELDLYGMLNVGGHVGASLFEDKNSLQRFLLPESGSLSSEIDKMYLDWSLYVSKSWADILWKLAYVDSSITVINDCRAYNQEACSYGAVFSATKFF